VNPGIVDSAASQAGGNLFAADTGDRNKLGSLSSDLLGGGVMPDLSSSKKISWSQIDVVWARQITTAAGANLLTLSTDFGSSLDVAPTNDGALTYNGVYVPNQQPDNLRMRDSGFPASEDGTGDTVKYFIGHPSQAADPSLGIQQNWAAYVYTQAAAKLINVPVVVHVMQYTDAAGALHSTWLTPANVQDIINQANTVWSQAGINFVLLQPLRYDGNLGKGGFDVTVGNTDKTVVENNLNFSQNAVNLYFADTLYDPALAVPRSSPFIAGITIIPQGGESMPGSIVATDGGIDPLTLQGINPYTLEQVARAAAHESGHYVMDKGNDAHKSGIGQDLPVQFLMTPDGQGEQRYLDGDEAAFAQKFDPTKPLAPR
jgi:hypothetical protein